MSDGNYLQRKEVREAVAAGQEALGYLNRARGALRRFQKELMDVDNVPEEVFSENLKKTPCKILTCTA